jgi:hypothetical protein
MSVFLPTRFSQEDPLFIGGNVIADTFDPLPTGWVQVGSSYKRALTTPFTNNGFNVVDCSDAVLSNGNLLIFEGGRLGLAYPGLALRTGVPVYFDIVDYKWKHKDGTEIEYPPDEPPYITDGTRYSTIRTGTTAGSEGTGDRSYHYRAYKLTDTTFLLRRAQNFGNSSSGLAGLFDVSANTFTWRNGADEAIAYYNQPPGVADGQLWNGALAGNGEFYAMGGNRYSNPLTLGLDEICKFNPSSLSSSSGHWTVVDTMDMTFGTWSSDNQRVEHFAIGLADGRIWCGGGRTGSAAQYRINTWYFDYTNIGGTPVTNGPDLPVDWSGTHDGGNGSATLIDSTANFSGLVNRPILNTTQGWQATVSSVDSTTELSYTGSNTFDNGDGYAVLFESSLDHFRELAVLRLNDGRIYLANNSRALIFDPDTETFIDSRDGEFEKLPIAINAGSVIDHVVSELQDGRLFVTQQNGGTWISTHG